MRVHSSALLCAFATLLFGCEHAAEEHDHVHTPHDGIVARLLDAEGAPAGYVELKLHDDKGDLELWIAQDAAMLHGLALPIDLDVVVEFPELEKRSVLKVRDTERNEDEDGNVNLKDGHTHYFLHPHAATPASESVEWRKGANFAAKAQVSYEVSGRRYQSESFELRPHTHHDHEH